MKIDDIFLGPRCDYDASTPTTPTGIAWRDLERNRTLNYIDTLIHKLRGYRVEVENGETVSDELIFRHKIPIALPNEILKLKTIKKKTSKPEQIEYEMTKYDFVAIDFETSNPQKSICAVGLVAVKDGEIVSEKHWYVCPASPNFHSMNVNVHGISYEKVKDCPNFLTVWEDLKHYIIDQKLVAHSAGSSDIDTLKKAFSEFGITPPPQLDYDCTLNLSRVLLPQLENHKLPTIAKYFNVPPYNEHDALDDARVCAMVYLEMMKMENETGAYAKHILTQEAKKTDYLKSILPKADLSGLKFMEEAQNISFNGKNVVVTGKFREFPNRDALKQTLTDMGANMKSSIGKNINLVVIGEDAGPSKVQLIEALINGGCDIQVIEENTLYKILNV